MPWETQPEYLYSITLQRHCTTMRRLGDDEKHVLLLYVTHLELPKCNLFIEHFLSSVCLCQRQS